MIVNKAKCHEGKKKHVSKLYLFADFCRIIGETRGLGWVNAYEGEAGAGYRTVCRALETSGCVRITVLGKIEVGCVGYVGLRRGLG
jgi:hypothetical protein